MEAGSPKVQSHSAIADPVSGRGRGKGRGGEEKKGGRRSVVPTHRCWSPSITWSSTKQWWHLFPTKHLTTATQHRQCTPVPMWYTGTHPVKPVCRHSKVTPSHRHHKLLGATPALQSVCPGAYTHSHQLYTVIPRTLYSASSKRLFPYPPRVSLVPSPAPVSRPSCALTCPAQHQPLRSPAVKLRLWEANPLLK